MWDPFRPKYPPKCKNSNIWRKKEENPFVKARQGHITHVRKISWVCQKRRGYWTPKEFGVSCLNQPVEVEKRREQVAAKGSASPWLTVSSWQLERTLHVSRDLVTWFGR